MEELKQRWDEIKELLRKEHELLDIPYKTWILPLKIHVLEGDNLIISVPDNFNDEGAEYIEKKYGLFLKVCIAEVTNKEYELSFVTEGKANNNIKKVVSSYNNKNNNRIENAGINPKYTFEEFVVGDGNQFAQAAAVAVAENPGNVFNPLFIYSGPGLGKTHLMHAIGNYIIQNNSNYNVLYVTSEKFTNEVIEALKSGQQAMEMKKFREKYRNIDVLLIDDIQFIIGKESTQLEFFNTFNDLHSKGKAIVITSDKPPKEMRTLEERFKNRFEWGLTADINPPEYETRMAILKRHSEKAGYDIDDEILQYIANNIKSNVRELEGALNKVIALCNLNREKKISLSTAEDALKDLILTDSNNKITPHLIIETVANYFNIVPSDLESQKRNKEIVIPRQIAMYICKDITDSPLELIGEYLGGKDHSTVIYGCNKIKKLISSDNNVKKAVEDIYNILNNG